MQDMQIVGSNNLGTSESSDGSAADNEDEAQTNEPGHGPAQGLQSLRLMILLAAGNGNLYVLYGTE